MKIIVLFIVNLILILIIIILSKYTKPTLRLEEFNTPHIKIWCSDTYLTDKTMISIPSIDTNKEYIPRIIHQVFLSGWETVPECCKKIISENIKLNPKYQYNFYSDQDIINLIDKFGTPREKRSYLKINPLYAASRCDFARYLIVYYLGGVYIDIKAKINMSLDPIIQRESLFIIQENICDSNQFTKYKDNRNCFSNWLIIFPKKHYLLRKVIDHIMDNLENSELINNINNKEIFDKRNKIWVLTGPIAYSTAISRYINNYKHIILPKIGWYAHNHWQLDNFIEYDGSNGEYHNNNISSDKHYSLFGNNIPVVINGN